MLTKKVVKVGNSVGALLPKTVREMLGWEGELELEYHLDGNSLTLKPVSREPRPPIETLDLFGESISV